MDYSRFASAITAGLAIASLSLPSSMATSEQGLVLTGRLSTGSTSVRSPAVRLRCPGFQTETLATHSGYFTIRMPRSPGHDSSPVPSHPKWDSRSRFSSAQQLSDSLECRLEIRSRETALVVFRISIPQNSQHLDLGDVQLPDSLDAFPGNHPTVQWRSLIAPPEASAVCAQVREELNKKRPDLERANRLLERALQRDPNMAEAWELLGAVENAEGHSQAARIDLEKAVKLDDHSYEAYTLMAQLDLREQRWTEALDHCERALTVEPSWLQAQYLRAFAAYNLGNFDTARDACRRLHASGETGRFDDIAVVDALLLAEEGKTAEASSVLRSFLDRNPAYEHRSELESQLASWEDSGSESTTSNGH